MADMTGADYSPDLYEVTAGKRRHKTEKGEWVRLTKGDTFHPTLKQVADGSLENAARKVKEGSPKASVSPGADIGIRALEMSPAALKKALDAEPPVTEEELEAAGGPSGETGYVVDDVTAVLEARAAEEAAEGEEEPDDSGGD